MMEAPTITPTEPEQIMATPGTIPMGQKPFPVVHGITAMEQE